VTVASLWPNRNGSIINVRSRVDLMTNGVTTNPLNDWSDPSFNYYCSVNRGPRGATGATRGHESHEGPREICWCDQTWPLVDRLSRDAS